MINPTNGAESGGTFTVYYPDGSIASYTTKSLLDYAITRYKDVNGNVIDYRYESSNNTLRIKKIKYGHREGGTAYNEIEFIYKDRQNPVVSYVANHRLVRSKVVDEVHVNTHNALYRKYKLEHILTSSNYHQLTSVKEYNRENKEKPAIEFDYGAPTQYQLAKKNYDFQNVLEGDREDLRFVSGKFIGNGYLDFVSYHGENRDEIVVNYTEGNTIQSIKKTLPDYLKHFDNLYATNIASGADFIEKNTLTFLKEYAPSRSSDPLKSKLSLYNCGFNKSNQDLTLTEQIDYEFDKVYIETREGRDGPLDIYGTVPKNFISGDFDGDGITDFIAIEKKQTSVSPLGEHSTVNTLNNQSNVYFLNVKDKSQKRIGNLIKQLTEKILVPEGSSRVVRNYGNGSSGSNDIVYREDAVVETNYQLQAGDHNGDGKTDLYVFYENQIYIYSLSEEGELVQLTNYFDSSRKFNEISVYPGDYNGDGKTDFLVPKEKNNNTWDLYISKGISLEKQYKGAFTEYKYTTHEPVDGYYSRFLPFDANYDGKTDLVGVKILTGGQVATSLYEFSNNSRTYDTRILKKVSSSLGIAGVSHKLPLLMLDTKAVSQYLNFAFLRSGYRNSNVVSFNFSKDHGQDVTLQSVQNTGNKKKITLSYVNPLAINQDYYSATSNGLPYAHVNNLRGFKLIKQLKEYTETSLYRSQDYKYYGATSDIEGIGFLGFKGIAKSNWYDDKVEKIWNVSYHKPELRGALVDSYRGFDISFTGIPSGYISKEHYDYNTKLLANPNSTHFDGIPTDLTLNQIMNNTFQIAKRRIRLTTGFKAQGSKGKFKASIVGNPDQTGANGYAGVYINFPTRITSNDNLTKTTTTKSFTYDDYWSPTLVSTHYNGAGTTEERFEYLNNPSATSGYYMARVKKQTDKTIAYGGSFTSSTEYSYDSKGQATRIIKRGNGGSDFLEESLTYDVFGNIKTRSLKGTGVSARNESFIYDTTGRFVTEKTDIEGLKTTYANNVNTGLLISETDHLGLTTSYTYDSWNRPKTVTNYLNKTASYTYKTLNNGGFGIEETNAQNTINKKTYYDQHGRIDKEMTLSLNGGWISVESQYDVLDRKVRQSEPYNAGSANLWTVTKFDQYGRVNEVTAPTGRKMTTSYNGLTVSVNDQVQTKITVKDALGNTLSHRDHGGEITYHYFPNGNMKSSSYADNTIVVEQDHWGRKTKLTDPSAGVYQYIYNIFGETLEEINPKGKTTTTYDVNGRVTRKTIQDDEKNYSVDYVYHATTKLLQRVNAHTDDINSVAYVYDNYGRPTKVTEDNSRAIYTKEITYDNFGRTASDKVTAKSKAKNQNFASTINYNYEYGSGILEKVTDTTGKTLYEIDVLNQRGQVTAAKFGNGINITNQYDTYGYLTKQRHASASYTAMDYDYTFNKIRGNLETRKNYALSSHYAETFGYDELDRLTTISATSAQSNMTYEDDGRIKTNSTVGAYTYNNSGSIFQLADIDLNTKGKQLFNNRELQEAQFTSFKKPTHIKEAGNGEAWFEYNGGLTRSYAEIKKEDGSEHLIKHYSADGSTEIIEDELTGESKIVHYFGGPYQANISYIAQYNAQNSQIKAGFHYLHRDYLGSLVAISDQNGAILEKRHYGAWGKLEKYESSDSQHTTQNPLLDRGWTGHEHFAQVNLVHMNGRMYDADLGRFLAPDNYVQDPSNTQNFNRYQYGFNNPLKYTDPSGEFFGVAIGIAMAYYSISKSQGSFNPLSWDWNSGALWGTIALAAFTTVVGAKVFKGVEAVLNVGGFIGGAIAGAASGVVTGVIGGVGNAFIYKQNILKSAFRGAAVGAVTGAIMGGVSKGIQAMKHGGKFLNGNGEAHDFAVDSNTADTSQNTNEIEYSNQSAERFSDEHFPGARQKYLNKLHADGSVPNDNYTIKNDGTVLTPRGNETFGTTIRQGGKINMYLYKNAFGSASDLFLTMQHEYIHAGFSYLDMPDKGGKYQYHHRSIYSFQAKQIATWDHSLINPKILGIINKFSTLQVLPQYNVNLIHNGIGIPRFYNP